MNTKIKNSISFFLQSILNSYSQIFFSDNKFFAGIILGITFIDLYTGLFGLLSVIMTNAVALWIGLDKYKITKGFYAFNSLLIGLGLGVYFAPSFLLLFIVLLSGVLSLFLSVTLEGVLGKYGLPYLSIPFVISIWILTLATREFGSMHLNERGVYLLNDLYSIGGSSLVKLYNWGSSIPLPSSLKTYFLSLGSIFFQYNLLAGILLSVGLIIYSRIAFTLSLLGFYTAYLFYILIGTQISEITYSYIGFNYILTSIAIGGFFIVPNRSSFLWVMILIPLVAIITISLSKVVAVYNLPIYSLPFNLVALLFLYVLKFRINNRANLNAVLHQFNSPEKNLYSFLNVKERFGKETYLPMNLPFFGEWSVTQGHNGDQTHIGEWQHAWDFEIKDEENKSFRKQGDFCDDYYCYNKNIIAPANGVIEEIVNDVLDNTIGEKNLEHNWGNTIVIKHAEFLYSKLCHLKKDSIQVKIGDVVKTGNALAKCGNSGNSPYPHLHFQLQATPYVGSNTMEYPISYYLLKTNQNFIFKTNEIPLKEDQISSLQTNTALRKAFHFIPGETICFKIDNDSETTVKWNVKLDYLLNKYIECDETKSKAFFKMDEHLLYFTHFEGNRKSLLYYFYLAAFKVSFGFYENLVLTDSYPINMVFKTSKIFLQDFMSPFFRYLKCNFVLKYSGNTDCFSDSGIILKSNTSSFICGRKNHELNFTFTIDNRGIDKFEIKLKNKTILAQCIKE